MDSDNQTIISDITDISSAISFNMDEKLVETKQKVEDELNKLTMDTLKEKSKDFGINGSYRMKKPELVDSLTTEFMKMVPILKEKKNNELKNICKYHNIKITGTVTKKESLIYQILTFYATNLKFRLDDIPITHATAEQMPVDTVKKESLPPPVQELSLIEQLEKQRLEIENKIKEESDRKRKKEEEEKQRLEEEAKKRQDDEKKKEKEEMKKKKQTIPKNVRIIVWNNYIGEDIIKHKCLCCKKVTISNTNYEVGHVLSEKNGGTHEINNLRPICFACNHSMGTENMIDFVVKFGLYIG